MGLAAAKALLPKKAKVSIASRSEERLAEAQAEIQGQIGQKVETQSLDVTQEEAVQKFFREAGAFDHIVVTSVTFNAGSLHDLDTAVARQAMDGKFWGPYLVAKYAQINNGGSLVLFSGSVSRRPSPGATVMVAAAAAVEALGRALALDLAPIRVNVISPGWVDTPLAASVLQEQREGFYQQMAERLPVKRIGVPEDIASTVIHLMENSYITGVVIDVDGGGLLI